MIQAIANRRSIRKYTDRPVSKADLEDILNAGILAPSAKNRQPWKFIVVQGKAKEEARAAFMRGIAREEQGDAVLPNSRSCLAAAKHTVDIMAQAPVAIFIVNPLGKGIFSDLNAEERIYDICNIQSLSASIENMLLAAADKGMGGLWICDIYFAYQELTEWLKPEGNLMAAVSLGWPAESPAARPRQSLDETVEWRTE